MRARSVFHLLVPWRNDSNDPQTRFIGQFLQFQFPKPYREPVAASPAASVSAGGRLRICCFPIYSANRAPDLLYPQLWQFVIHAQHLPTKPFCSVRQS